MEKKKILFLGETYRADAITWIQGLREFGNFEIQTWELKTPNNTKKNKAKRLLEILFAPISLRKIIQKQQPDLILAERTTSYGFLAATTDFPIIIIAQQGLTDLWPQNSILLPIKKIIQKYAFKKASLVHAWGPVMTISMQKQGVPISKIMVLPKGINLQQFTQNYTHPNQIAAIVTRSLEPEYQHAKILQAFAILQQQGVPFSLTIVGGGSCMASLQAQCHKLGIQKNVYFKGKIANADLPKLLQQSNFYISLPVTEGVSASLFEAMASHAYPIVSNILGNQSWIKHRQNGSLVPTNQPKILADEILFVHQNQAILQKAIHQNRQFVSQHTNYHTNMPLIVQKYHQLLQSKQ